MIVWLIPRDQQGQNAHQPWHRQFAKILDNPSWLGASDARRDLDVRGRVATLSTREVATSVRGPGRKQPVEREFRRSTVWAALRGRERRVYIVAAQGRSLGQAEDVESAGDIGG